MTATGDPLAVLQRIRKAPPRPPPGERCEICAEPISDEHGHLVDIEARNLLCACRGCYLLFTSPGAGGGHFRSVPDRYLAFPGFRLSAAQWEKLQIPVSVAFFFVNSSLDRVAAFYPSPAGATESLLPLDMWDELVAVNPTIGTIEPDVEALMVRAGREEDGAECFLVPIDACYELVGEMRRLWRGFDGGSEAHEALDAFFARIRARAK
jgi:hypothetical protein